MPKPASFDKGKKIPDKEYCVQFDDIQRRIKELQG